MKLNDVIAALGLPDSAMVNQRIPKKLLAENGAPTFADKRGILEDIEELQWVAALKPVNIAVPAYLENTRIYEEIAVLSLELRPAARPARLAELVHRAIPYPVLLFVSSGHSISVSLAHIRQAQNEADKTVLDGDATLANVPDDETGQRFLQALALAKQPRTDLFALYQGWIDTVTALEAAALTGHFSASVKREQAEVRHKALQQCREIQTRIDTLRTATKKERQLARQVATNNEIKSLTVELSAAKAILNQGTP